MHFAGLYIHRKAQSQTCSCSFILYWAKDTLSAWWLLGSYWVVSSCSSWRLVFQPISWPLMWRSSCQSRPLWNSSQEDSSTIWWAQAWILTLLITSTVALFGTNFPTSLLRFARGKPFGSKTHLPLPPSGNGDTIVAFLAFSSRVRGNLSFGYLRKQKGRIRTCRYCVLLL